VPSRRSSGLIMTQVAEGTGASPKATDTVKVNYHRHAARTHRVSTAPSSVVRPPPFPAQPRDSCWTSVQKMKVGGRRQGRSARPISLTEIAVAPPKIKPRAAAGLRGRADRDRAGSPAKAVPPGHP